MKLRYPTEAFALGIILFSAGMKEAFTAGILVILSAAFAEFLKNLLDGTIPEWSQKLCVYIAAASLSSSIFLVGFAYLGTGLTSKTQLNAFVLGLLCAHHALIEGVEAEYGEMFFESALAWGFWIFLAAFREFMGSGMIFGNMVIQNDFQSKSFLGSTFAFLTAALTLAFTNGILKKSSSMQNSLWIIIPAAALIRPFTIAGLTGFAEYLGILWTVLVPVALFLSVKQTLKFSRPGKAYRGLPADMLAAGFIYMILSIY